MLSDKCVRLLILFMLIVFIAGFAAALYPYAKGLWVERKMAQAAASFIKRCEQVAAPSDVSTYYEHADYTGMRIEEENAADAPVYPELWTDMSQYNEDIFAQSQSLLSDERAYEEACFILADYGLDSEVFGVIVIPDINLNMPIYLGASAQNMAEGAACLSQTSLPIGGTNTNAVIAGHRGWCGSPYFRYITDLEIGDTVLIINPWNALAYKVIETKIIAPDEVDAILIQPGKDMVTLLTCHPYASGGKQRYLVYCERSNEA